MRKRYSNTAGCSHAIGPFRKCLDNYFLVLISPPSHAPVRINDRSDKVSNIIPLSTLVMEGYTVRCRCQGPKGSPDVDFGTTCGAKMQIRKVQVNQSLYKRQDLVSR